MWTPLTPVLVWRRLLSRRRFYQPILSFAVSGGTLCSGLRVGGLFFCDDVTHLTVSGERQAFQFIGSADPFDHHVTARAVRLACFSVDERRGACDSAGSKDSAWKGLMGNESVR